MLTRRALGRDDVSVAACLLHARLRGHECDSAGTILTDRQNLERIQSSFRVAARMGVASSGSDGDGIALNSWIAKDRQRQISGGCTNGDEIPVRQSHSLGGRRVHLGDRLPANLRYRIWNLLQPGLVGTASVADEGMRVHDQVHVPARLIDRRCRMDLWNGSRRGWLSE